MQLELQHFRPAWANRYVLVMDSSNNPIGIKRAELNPFEVASKSILNRCKWYGNDGEREQNRKIKAVFLNLLMEQEGKAVVQRVYALANLPGHWLVDPKPLSGRKIKRVFAAVEQCHREFIAQNRRGMAIFMTSSDDQILLGGLLKFHNDFQDTFEDVFHDTLVAARMSTLTGKPTLSLDIRITADDQYDPQLLALVRREIERQPAFRRCKMSASDMSPATVQAIERFGVEREVLWRVWAIAQQMPLDVARLIGACLKQVTKWSRFTWIMSERP